VYTYEHDYINQFYEFTVTQILCQYIIHRKKYSCRLVSLKIDKFSFSDYFYYLHICIMFQLR